MNGISQRIFRLASEREQDREEGSLQNLIRRYFN
jgi:hypothetical protein